MVSIAAVLAACNPSATTTTISGSAATGFDQEARSYTVDLSSAVATRVVVGADGSAWVTWSEERGVMVARLDLGRGELAPSIRVSGEEGVFAHPIERPALAVDAEGRVFVAWISGLGDVRLATLTKAGEVTPSRPVSGDVRHETVLVHLAVTDSGEPVLTYLEDSTLSVTLRDASGGLAEHELVDDRTCDCCHPVPLMLGDRVGVGYRNADEVDGRIVRDIYFVSGSLTGQFGAPVAIADDHWFLDACPFSGPSLTVATGGELIAAWMDGRQSIHPDQDATSIWIDRSRDGGVTFGADHRLTNDEAIHRSPSLVTDEEGVVHLIWERRTPEAATIEYVTSTDGALTWSSPLVLIEDEAGAPREASLAIVDDHLLVSWTDNDGGHVGIWQLP